MVNYGVAAIFGPVTSYTAAHVQSICNAFEIPHIQWHWDGRDVPDYFSISLFPHYLTLSTAYRDIISYWGWNRFAVLYEENAGLLLFCDKFIVIPIEFVPFRMILDVCWRF